MTADFFRNRLDQMIDLRHPLAVLANRMPWQELEASLAHRFARQVRAGMPQHHTWPGAVAMCVVGGRCALGARDRLRWAFCPAWRSTRAKLDSLARYRPSSANRGTMRAGGISAKRGSLATRNSSARSASFKACEGLGRWAWGR